VLSKTNRCLESAFPAGAPQLPAVGKRVVCATDDGDRPLTAALFTLATEYWQLATEYWQLATDRFSS